MEKAAKKPRAVASRIAIGQIGSEVHDPDLEESPMARAERRQGYGWDEQARQEGGTPTHGA